MRTFIALNLPAGTRQRLHRSLEALRGRGLPVRWTPADSLHLTLKFLGDTEGSEVGRIEDTLRILAGHHHPVSVRVGGLGAFPSLRRAAILWLGVQPDDRLMALQAELELAFSRLGYGRETRPFRPHLTVARLDASGRPPDLGSLSAPADAEASEIVHSVDLMRSHTQNDAPPRYEALLRVPLATPEEAP